MQLRVSRPIDAPAESVWAAITDVTATSEILSGVEKVERLDEGTGFDVGTRWRETRRMFGKEATEEMEVTDVEPGRSYTVRSVHGRTTYTSGLEVEPAGNDASQLSMTFGAEASGLALRIAAATIGRLASGATKRMIQQDLDDIATHVEADRAGA